MKRIFYIYSDPDSYEVLVQANTIIRITKTLSDSQEMQTCLFNELPEAVQIKIINKGN